MNRKNRQREAGWILALTEAEAEAAAWEAKAKFWQAVHRERTNEALRLPVDPTMPTWDSALGLEPLRDWEREILEAREARP
jgi:hypothetical protein